jgi:hypothetical protein
MPNTEDMVITDWFKQKLYVKKSLSNMLTVCLLQILCRAKMQQTKGHSLCKHEVLMKMIAFWDIAPCSLTEVDWCFRAAHYLHHQGNDSLSWWWRQNAPLKHWSTSTRLHGAVSQKAVRLHTCYHENLKSQEVLMSLIFLFGTLMPTAGNGTIINISYE